MIWWRRELTFIEGSPYASDSPTLISHLIFTKTSCRISSSHSAPGETKDLQRRYDWKIESIKENHREDSRDYSEWKHVTLFRTSNLFWSCQYLVLNLLIPIGKDWGGSREESISNTRGAVPRHTWPHFHWKVSQYGGRVKQSLSPQRKDKVQRQYTSSRKDVACFCPGDWSKSSNARMFPVCLSYKCAPVQKFRLLGHFISCFPLS